MNIVFFTGSMNKGGAERVLSILTRMYAERGHNVTIVTLLEDVISYELHPKVKYVSIAKKRRFRALNYFHWIKGIKEIVKKEKPDIVISFFAKISFLVVKARVYKKARLFISERNSPKYFYTMSMKILSRLLFKHAEKLIMQTKEAYEFMPKNIQKKAVIIYNPVERIPYQASYKEDKIVAVGRLTNIKNHASLITAFSKLPATFNNYKLYIYGQGPLKEELEKLADNLGVRERVILAGVKDNIFEEISDAKLFVLPSRAEGLSNALLEAMIMGHVIIGSDIPGINNVLIDGKTGYLFKSGDSEELLNVIENTLANYETAKVVGDNAKKYMETEYDALSNQKWLELIEPEKGDKPNEDITY